MKFIINSSVLLKALDNVQGVVDKRNITPILSNIRISVENDRLLINATDMDLDIVEILDAEIIEQGSTTAPAYMMHETVKKLPNDSSIEFSLVEDTLTIKCGKFTSSLKCLPVEDFPIIQTRDLPNSFRIKTQDLKKLLEKTRFAISLDETRYYLNGIFLHTCINDDNQKVLRSVATDGHRLALVEVECSNGVNIDEGIIIPKKSVEEICKLLDKTTTEFIEVASSSTRICIKLEKLILTSKLIDGNFPNYSRVIPKDNNKVLEVNRNEFVNAVNLISIYSDDKLKMVKLDIKGKDLTLSANRTDGLAKQWLSLANEVEEMNICFNARYIQDVCNLIKTENIVMNLSSSANPALIKQADKNDELFVIMPMRI